MELDRQGETIYIAPQNLIEFQALATLPVTANGLGLTPAQASTEAKRFEAVFPVLPETPDIYVLWCSIVGKYQVHGRQVYDARIVAVMQAYYITHLLTLDPTDFRRFANIITIVEPRDVV
jgi:predicted nucleic acid-binding protein